MNDLAVSMSSSVEAFVAKRAAHLADMFLELSTSLSKSVSEQISLVVLSAGTKTQEIMTLMVEKLVRATDAINVERSTAISGRLDDFETTF